MKTNTIIMGAIGSGKSYSIRTLLAEYPDVNGKIHKGAGLKIHLCANEPGWEATNGDLTCEMGFHVCEVLPANPNWEVSLKWLESISGVSAADLEKKSLPASIMNDYRQFLDLYRVCINYICKRCGENFGSVSDWGEDIVYVNDGLTGISKMAVHFSVGPKPAMSWPEFNRSQKHIEEYVGSCCAAKCSYVLIAHWAREPDPVEGGTNITIHTVGQKLAPRLLLDTFDEIILAERTGDTYTWNLNDTRVDQKARRLPYRSALKPDFSQIFRKDT